MHCRRNKVLQVHFALNANALDSFSKNNDKQYQDYTKMKHIFQKKMKW